MLAEEDVVDALGEEDAGWGQGQGLTPAASVEASASWWTLAGGDETVTRRRAEGAWGCGWAPPQAAQSGAQWPSVVVSVSAGWCAAQAHAEAAAEAEAESAGGRPSEEAATESASASSTSKRSGRERRRKAGEAQTVGKFATTMASA